jgi:hypothetical protein
MTHETTMRHAFRDAIDNVLTSHKPVSQPRLVKRVVRVYEGGAGLRKPRAK